MTWKPDPLLFTLGLGRPRAVVCRSLKAPLLFSEQSCLAWMDARNNSLQSLSLGIVFLGMDELLVRHDSSAARDCKGSSDFPGTNSARILLNDRSVLISELLNSAKIEGRSRFLAVAEQVRHTFHHWFDCVSWTAADYLQDLGCPAPFFSQSGFPWWPCHHQGRMLPDSHCGSVIRSKDGP